MTTARVPGRIYVYSAPGYDTEWTRTTGSTTVTGRGRYKVGYTGREDPRVRIKEQTGTLYPGGDGIVIHIDEPAVLDDGSPFDDHAVHRVLDAAGVQRTSEVVEATLDEVKAAIAAVRSGSVYDPSRTQDFGMRPEQQRPWSRQPATSLSTPMIRFRPGFCGRRQDAVREDVRRVSVGEAHGLEAGTGPHL